MNSNKKGNLLIGSLAIITIALPTYVLFNTGILSFENKKLTIDEYKIPLYGWVKEVGDMINGEEFAKVSEVLEGTMLTDKSLVVKFEKNGHQCDTKLNANFDNDDSKKGNLTTNNKVILSSNAYMCSKKASDNETKELGITHRSFSGTEKLYLAAREGSKLRFIHNVEFFTKVDDITNELYFELDKSKEYVLINPVKSSE